MPTYHRVSGTLFTVTIVFSLITGTAAGVLSLLTWEVLRRSPFGRAVFLLSIALVIFVVYHVILLIAPDLSWLYELVKSALFTGIAGFIWLMVWSQHRIRRQATTEVEA